MNIPRDQVIAFTQFLFGMTRATDTNPRPCINTWVGGNVGPIRTKLRDLNVQIEGLEAETLEPTLASLVKYCRQYRRQPGLTRTLLTELDNWLTNADRTAKTDLINAAFPNEEAGAGVNDSFISFIDFVKDVQTGGELMLARYLDGSVWLDSYDKMRAYLSETKTLLPKVQLKKASTSELVTQAEKLITVQDQFWTHYKKWLEQTFSEPQLLQIKAVFPTLTIRTDRNFTQQTESLRNRDWFHMCCVSVAPHINPESLTGLSGIWKEINQTLISVGSV